MLTTLPQPAPVEPEPVDAISQGEPEAAQGDTSRDESGIQPRKEGRYKRLSVGMKIRVLELSADGLKPVEIGKILGISHQRVCDIIAQHGDKKASVRRIMDAGREKAASSWVSSIPIAAKKGDHRPARELLIATGDVSPLDSAGSGVTVVVNMPGSEPQNGAKVAGSGSTLDNPFVMPSPQVLEK